MKKLLAIVVLGLLLDDNAYAIPHWLGPAFELCTVTHNAMFYHHTRDSGEDSWRIEEGIIFIKLNENFLKNYTQDYT